MEHESVVALTVIVAVAIFCQWLSWWIKLPAILFLLSAGLALGPLTGWLDPDVLFGDLLFPMVSLSVAVILFEGALTLRFDQIRGLQAVVRNMLTFGLAVVWLVTASGTRFCLGFSWELSLLFGALMVVTGPTVIVPMLRTVRPNTAVSNVLRWEGVMIDPLGAILAVLVFGFILSGQSQEAFGHTLLVFGQTLTVGALLGSGAGYGMGLVLRYHWLPEYLHNVAALALVFATFTLSNGISEESGLLAVTVMGIWLANMRGVPTEDILDFKESLSVLLISGLFIVLAARVDFAQFQDLGWGAAGVFLIIQFIARPAKVLLSTWNSALNWRERLVIAWIGPRGIVAAAVSALFALRLEQAGIPRADLLVPLAFAVIIGTVLLQSATAKFIAQLLGVAEPEERGFLIIGANSVARAVAQALEDAGSRTLLTDSSWDHVRAARMAGLDVYFGNAVSEHADRHLDLVGLGAMIAMTPHRELNALASLRYRSEFGRRCVYTVGTENEEEQGEIKRRTLTFQPAAVLFVEDVTFSKLAGLIAGGATIRQTKVSESFGFADYLAAHDGRLIPLFAVSPKGMLRWFVQGADFAPDAGWTVVALVPEIGQPTGEAAT